MLHNIKPQKLIWMLTGLLLITTLCAENEESEEQLKQRLEQIKERLSEVKIELNKASGEEDKLLKELEKQDQLINKQGIKVLESEKRINQSKKEINLLTTEIKGRNNSIEKQKREIISLLKLSLYISHDRILKRFLFNSKAESAELTRHQINYLQQRLYALISDIAEQIIQLKNKREELQQQKIALENERDQLKNIHDQLIEQKQQRNLVLKSLKKTIVKYRSESENLEQDQNRLNNLIGALQTLLEDLPENLGENIPFNRLKGKLIWPLVGPIIRSYRSLRSGEARWDGIVIGNDAGTAIKAVAYGRVAFADWLRGYGLLIVIEHDSNYMTLYGHNQSILVETGDWVQTGESIATTGASGSIQNSGVYFEIRKQAKPFNPTKWFIKK